MEKFLWGKTKDGQDVYTYTFKNSAGMTFKFMNYGANILAITAPDKNGVFADVTLGYDKLDLYFDNSPCYGCAVGRHANRIGGAKFTLNGKTYELEKNDGKNNLHSGNTTALHHRVWDADYTDSSITFSINSPDGDMGFPGNMTIKVIYTITDDGLNIDYEALSDKDSVFNPTQHTYFNMAGHNSGLVYDQLLTVFSDTITPSDSASIPDGTLRNIVGTAMDFTTPTPIGSRINDDYDQLNQANGYDHNYVLVDDGSLHKACELYDPKSGRNLLIGTTSPGIQVYTGNYIGGDEVGKDGCVYESRFGIALETQFMPNALNVPSVAQPIAKANEVMKLSTNYHFSVK